MYSDIQQHQESLREWINSSFNIYESHELWQPSLSISPAYILNYMTLFNLSKEFGNHADLQKAIKHRFNHSEDFHKGAIYSMMTNQQSIKLLYDIISNDGFHDVLLFYLELVRFIDLQIHQIKSALKPNLFLILEVLLETPQDTFDEVFKSAMRSVNIYLLEPLYPFLNFVAKNFERILPHPRLALMLFYKQPALKLVRRLVLILNLDELHFNKQFPLKMVAQNVVRLWQHHQQDIYAFGRELYLNLQSPLGYAEQFLLPIKNDLKLNFAKLVNNEFLTKSCYKLNYHLALPLEVEQRFIFACFHQPTIESVKIALTMLFEKYGYHIHFIGQLIRHLACMVDFESEIEFLEQIGNVCLIIKEICDFSGEKWPIFLRYLFADLFFYNSAWQNDHNIKAGIQFLRVLHKNHLYAELKSTLWFIIQTIESNDSIKMITGPQLLSLSRRYSVFSKLTQDPQINDHIKIKIKKYFVPYVEPSQVCEDLHYIKSDEPYNVELESAESQDMQESPDQQGSILWNIETEQLPVPEGLYIEVTPTFYRILCKEKVDGLFMNPQDQALVIKFIGIFAKPLMGQVREMLINEGADVIKLLYEDHFYDINFEYPFNILVEILSMKSALLENLVYALIEKEPFSQTLLMIACFENRFQHESWPQYLLVRSEEEILESLQQLEKLLDRRRLDLILYRMLDKLIWKNKIFLKVVELISFSMLEGVALSMSVSQILEIYGEICKSPFERNCGLIQNKITAKVVEQPAEDMLQTMVGLLQKRNEQFWDKYRILMQHVLKSGKMSEQQLIKYFMEVLRCPEANVWELLSYVPNISKHLILKCVQQIKSEGTIEQYPQLMRVLEPSALSSLPQPPMLAQQVKNLLQQS